MNRPALEPERGREPPAIRILPILAIIAWASVSASESHAQIPEFDDTTTLRKAGDVLHIALPVAAGASASLLRDWEGLKQFSLSFGGAFATVFSLKPIIEKSRPDVADSRSFPSGHTMMSFSGASFIQRRYGPKFGVPALVAAGFVGYSRIKGQRHFTDDVIAGAGIALFYNFWITTPYSEKVQVQPIAPDGGYGVVVRVTW